MHEHISKNEWIRFFAREMASGEKLSVLRRCAECETCRKLLQAGQDMRFALRSPTRDEIPASEEQAYRAVASPPNHSASKARRGYLAVCLTQAGNGFIFSDDSLETSGWGNRYALNLSPDQKEYLDDGGALNLAITGSRIELQLKDPEVYASAVLLTDGLDEQSAILAPDADFRLPEGGYCELEITFGEE